MVDEYGSGVGPGGRGELLKRAQGGDRDAFDTLVVQLTGLLWRVARSQGVDRHTAEDVVQDTWLRFCGRLHTIHTPEAVVGWLVTVAKREAASRREAGRREVAAEGFDVGLAAEPGADEVADPDRAARARVLREALGRLSARCRVLLQIIAQVERPDYGVVAEATGMPRGSIGPTRGRCLARLRGLLEGWGEGVG
ncbi:sigma-70 family RNA polymerase sigma factor [Phytomonospora sp. NPDC050363]|uniref:RNA polymerase sigma factor n=1 Tax=Phytomonospora sp. NPDC050363 TaxID=3155642 RepID=UPI0033FF4F48